MVLAETNRRSIVPARVGRVVRTAVLAAVGLGLLAGCISRQAEPLVPELARPRSAAVSDTPPPKPVKGTIDLVAQGRGNSVTVTAVNLLGQPVTLGPKMFAVVVGGRAYPGDAKGVIAQLPIKTLAPEEGITGRFVYHRLGSLVGQRLVLNYPGIGVFHTIIQPSTAVPSPSAGRRPTTP